MSKINHQNIEQWLFDYAEGNLNPAQTRELNNFLQVHPEYQLDLDSWQEAHLEETEHVAPYAYEPELLAISNTGFSAWKYVAAASALLLIGTAAYTFFSSEKEQQLANSKELAAPADHKHQIAVKQDKNFNTKSADSYKKEQPDQTTNNHTAAVNNGHSALHQNNIVNNHNHILSHNTVRHTNNKQPNTVNNNSVNNNAFNANTAGNLSSGNNISSNTEEQLSDNSNTVTTNVDQIIEDVTVFGQEKTFDAEFAGNVMAHVASENLAQTNPDVANENANTDAKDANTIRKHKHFQDLKMGFGNNRDHLLMVPGNLNTAEYAAFAGSVVSPALNLNYRNQYAAQDNNIQSARFVYDQYSKKLHSAWGVGASTTKIGDNLYTANEATLYFSPKIKIKKGFTIEPGVSASYHENHVGSKAIVSSSQLEPYKGYVGNVLPMKGSSGPATINGFDMSTSVLVNARHFYVVGGVDHLLRPKLSFYQGELPFNGRTDMRFKGSFGTDFKQFHESKWSISPQISFVHQGTVNEVWVGSSFMYNKILMGASVAQNGQFLTSVGINAGILKINYNFDFTRSYLIDKYCGSHEISVRLALSGLNKKKHSILDQEK